MGKYRDHNLFTFIRREGISPMAWIMFLFGGLLAFGIGVLEIKDHFPIISPIFFSLTFVFFLLFSANNFSIYRKGKELYERIEEDVIDIQENLKVTVKNYNKAQLQAGILATVPNTDFYFESADIFLTNNSIILLGSNISFGLVPGYTNPIEILIYGNPRIHNFAILIDKPIISANKIELKIKDKYYWDNLTIKLESNEKLAQWLTHTLLQNKNDAS